jgi:lactate racemase
LEELSIPYTNQKSVSSKILSPSQVSWLTPKNISPSAPMEQLLDNALKNPVNSELFRVEKMNRVAVVIADPTRLTCPFISQLLEEIDKKTNEIKIIIACGTHVIPRTDYVQRILGKEFFSKYWFKVRVSSTQNPSSRYEYIGTTSRGTEVALDKEILDVDLILSSLNVRPHYFAGWEGGSKALLPGCSSSTSTASNHAYALDYEHARELRTEGNPIREDMNEVPCLLKKSRSINYRIVDFVANVEDQAVDIKYGEPVATHELLTRTCKEIYEIKGVPSPLAITVAEGPLGRTFYQSLKACSHATGILEAKNGLKPVVVLVASLIDGMGSVTFEEELERYAHKDHECILEDLKERADQGRFNEAVEKIYRLTMDAAKRDYAVVGPDAPKELETLLEKVGIKFSRDLDEILSSLKPELLRCPVNVIPRGASSIPTSEQFSKRQSLH